MKKYACLYLLFISSFPLLGKECRSDYDCSTSQKCIKTGYDYSGICTDVVDQYGNKLFNYMPNPNSINGNDGRGDCRYDNDCNYMFKCYKAKSYDQFGYCVKK